MRTRLETPGNDNAIWAAASASPAAAERDGFLLAELRARPAPAVLPDEARGAIRGAVLDGTPAPDAIRFVGTELDAIRFAAKVPAGIQHGTELDAIHYGTGLDAVQHAVRRMRATRFLAVPQERDGLRFAIPFSLRGPVFLSATVLFLASSQLGYRFLQRQFVSRIEKQLFWTRCAGMELYGFPESFGCYCALPVVAKYFLLERYAHWLPVFRPRVMR